MVTTPNSGAPMRAKDGVKHDPSNGQFASGGGSSNPAKAGAAAGAQEKPFSERSHAEMAEHHEAHKGLAEKRGDPEAAERHGKAAEAHRAAGRVGALAKTPGEAHGAQGISEAAHASSREAHAGRSNADLRDDYNKHVGSGNAAGAASVSKEQERRAGATEARFEARKPSPEKKPTEGRSTRARLLRGRDAAMYPDEKVGEHPAKNLDEGPAGRDGAMDAPRVNGMIDWPGRVV